MGNLIACGGVDLTTKSVIIFGANNNNSSYWTWTATQDCYVIAYVANGNWGGQVTIDDVAKLVGNGVTGIIKVNKNQVVKFNAYSIYNFMIISA